MARLESTPVGGVWVKDAARERDVRSTSGEKGALQGRLIQLLTRLTRIVNAHKIACPSAVAGRVHERSWRDSRSTLRHAISDWLPVSATPAARFAFRGRRRLLHRTGCNA